MSINALVKKVITRHLPIIMGLTIMAQTQVAKARPASTAQIVERQVALAQMEGPTNLTTLVPVPLVLAQRLFFPILAVIHFLVVSHTKPTCIAEGGP